MSNTVYSNHKQINYDNYKQCLVKSTFNKQNLKKKNFDFTY